MLYQLSVHEKPHLLYPEESGHAYLICVQAPVCAFTEIPYYLHEVFLCSLLQVTWQCARRQDIATHAALLKLEVHKLTSVDP